MWRFSRASAAGPGRLSRAASIRTIRRARSDSLTRCRICRTTPPREARCMFSRFPKVAGRCSIADCGLQITDLRRMFGSVNPQWKLFFLLSPLFLISCAGKAETPPVQQTQAAATAPTPLQPRQHLRVCVDPNNLPVSNELGDGFENKIAALVAREMTTVVQYTWCALMRCF